MSDEQMDDLKQFIGSTISQQTSDIKEDLQRVELKVDGIASDVGDALENSNQEVDKQLKNHEKRITKLEHKPA